MLMLTSCGGSGEEPFGAGFTDGLVIDAETHSVTLEGRIHPRRYNSDPDRAHGHHLITWEGGGRAGQALIETQASDYEIARAMRSLGAQSGRPLPAEVWSERSDRDSPYPDYHAEGTSIAIEVDLDVRISVEDNWRPLAAILEDAGGQGIDVHFQGQEELIATWKSGCVVCAASCPGAKAPNAGYTIRDQINGVMDFRVDTHGLPPDGSPVRVRMRLEPAG